MIRISSLMRHVLYSRIYIWVDVVYIIETQKAVLIAFDGQKAWIPKTWLCRIKRKNGHCVIASPPKAGEVISVKISDYHWAKKFA